ncbi:MAG: hypothetical protein NTV98_05095 [Candidatus Roizmanbacteria bacterium]|nr:hypothetical protein [Candidatus Roizmanbacteria bacterium]
MRKLIPIFILTFLLYLAVSYISTPITNFDAQSYSQIGALTLKGINIYPDPAISRHPYFPFFLYLEAGALLISQLIHIPQILILKCFFSLFHLASIYIVFHLSKKSLRTTWIYALNPISLLIIAFHGQFDIIPLFLILFSIFLLKQKKYASIMFYLGIAFTLKTWPILFIIPFLKRTPRKYWLWFIFPPILTIIVYSLFFQASLFSLVRVFAVYQGVGGIWGFGKVLSLISTNKIVLFVSKIVFVGGLFFYSMKQKKKLIVEELFEIMFLFFIFTPGFGLQWFLWLIPFFFLTKKPYMYIFMAAITICLCVSYLTWFPMTTVTTQMAYLALLLLWPVLILYYGLFFLFPKS